MERDDVKQVVRMTLLVMARLARRTRTQADDLLAGLLQANEERITEAVAHLCADGCAAPSDDRLAEALERVGIKA